MKKLLPIFIITILLYLGMIYISASLSNYDVQSCKIIGELTLSGKSVYPTPANIRNPYLPLFLYLEAGTLFLSNITSIPQMVLMKFFYIFFHLLSVYCAYILSKKNRKVTLFYAINPISLLITAYHGQFDIMPLSLILFSIILIQKKRYPLLLILLGCAVTLKTWPILFIVPFLRRIQKKYWYILLIPPTFFVIFYSFLFHSSLLSIARVLLTYQGVSGIWGLGMALSFMSSSKLFLFIYKLFFVFGLLLFSIKQKKTTLIEEVSRLILFFFIFTPGFGLQWFLWLVPFLFISKKPYIFSLFIPLFITICIAYASWIFPQAIKTSSVSLVLMSTFFFIFLYTLYVEVISRRNEHR